VLHFTGEFALSYGDEIMLRGKIFGPASLVLVAAAGLSGCLSNPEKKESAPAPQAQTPTPVAQAPATPAPQAAPAAPPAKGKSGKGSKKGESRPAGHPDRCRGTGRNACATAPGCALRQDRAGHECARRSGGFFQGGIRLRAEGQGLARLRRRDHGPAGPGGKFTRLQIGMPMKQVTDLIGQPSDQGAYITGKAFIPFYFGGDTHRQELVYKTRAG
jgi:hypothetical protein